MGGVKAEVQPLVGGDLKALGDPQIVRLHPQEARHQRPVRAVALAGIGKGAVEADVRPRHFRPQQGPGHAADPHRPRCVGAGGPHHHRTQNIKNVQHICVPPGDPKLLSAYHILPVSARSFPGKVDLSPAVLYTGSRKERDRHVLFAGAQSADHDHL